MISESAKKAWLVIAMDFFHYIAFMCTKPYIKSLLNEAGASDRIAGVILALYSLVQVLNAVLMAKWIQKKGQKPQMVLGAAMYFAGGLLLAYVSGISSLFESMTGIGSGVFQIMLIAISVAVLGSSHGMFIITCNYFITGIPKEEGRDRYVGYTTFVNSVGQFIGPILAAMLLAGRFSGTYKYVLLLSVSASAVSLIMAFFVKNVTLGTKKKPAMVRDVLKDRPLMKIVLLNAAVYFATDVVASYIEPYGKDTLALGASVATLILASMKFSAIFVRAFLGWLSEKIGSERLLRISLFTVSASIFLLGAVNETAIFLSKLGLPENTTKIVIVMLIGLIYGMANGLVNPLALVELSNKSDETNRSPALALRNICNSGGQTLGEVVFGFLAGLAATLSPVFYISGGLLFGCSFLSVNRKSKK